MIRDVDEFFKGYTILAVHPMTLTSTRFMLHLMIRMYRMNKDAFFETTQQLPLQSFETPFSEILQLAIDMGFIRLPKLKRKELN